MVVSHQMEDYVLSLLCDPDTRYALEMAGGNLRNTATISQSANEAFEASQQRYSSGVGNILELLSAQTTLAGAEQLRIQAQADWRTARLQLAASLGKLGMWAVK